jgi:acetyl-CoA carboxylase carboxyltransferase component
VTAEERDDLAELRRREELTRDEARHEAVRRRHEAGGRTARENLDDLVDPGSLVEYGRFAIAAQRGRRELDDLIARTPADGLIGGTARVNGELFGERAACAD